MLIFVCERLVQRCADTSSQDYQKVTDMKSRTLFYYESPFVPRVGETVVIGEDQAYDVVSVVYNPRDVKRDGQNLISVILEVEPHKREHKFWCGCYYKEDFWPLISELPSDNSELFKECQDEN